MDVTGTAPGLNHSHFTALQVKNALIDRQRDLWGKRSSIDLDEPDLCLHVHLHRGEASLSLDGSGGSLHRRGYRAAMGVAPLKENLAAGLIRLTGWDGSAPLTDPCCGSGTLLIEAASMALQRFLLCIATSSLSHGRISIQISGKRNSAEPRNGSSP